MTVRSVLTLHPSPGRVDALVEEYRARGIIEAAIPFGLLRGEALQPADAPDRIVVTSLWRAQADYDAWLASTERVRVTEGVWPLLDPALPTTVESAEVDADASEPIDAAAVAGRDATRLITVVPTA